MDSTGGCCIARYTGGGGGGGAAYYMSKVDRIMLRYRPIAPKPATGGSVSMVETKYEANTRSRRGRKRLSKENSNDSMRRCNKKKKVSIRGDEVNGCGTTVEKVVTLPLLPETPDRKDPPLMRSTAEQKQETLGTPKWLSFDGSMGENIASRFRRHQLSSDPVSESTDLTVAVAVTETETLQMEMMVVSCVTVECVTDMWINGEELGLGNTDEEKLTNLDKDTCPGFVSDGLGRVTWTNEEYRKMVLVPHHHHQSEERMIVRLVMRERLMLTSPAFTCKVRLQYTCGKDKTDLTLPCDVWRMDGGGFAWRLDVKAALCLGR